MQDWQPTCPAVTFSAARAPLGRPLRSDEQKLSVTVWSTRNGRTDAAVSRAVSAGCIHSAHRQPVSVRL